MDNVKNDLQGCSNFRMGTKAEDKLTVVLRFVLAIMVRIKRIYISKNLNPIIFHCNLNKIAQKSNNTINYSKLHIYKHKHKTSDTPLTYLLEIYRSK